MILMTARSDMIDDEISSVFWTSATFVSGLMAVYVLIHAIVYINGAYQSCKQYRNELIKYMQATGLSKLSFKTIHCALHLQYLLPIEKLNEISHYRHFVQLAKIVLLV